MPVFATRALNCTKSSACHPWVCHEKGSELPIHMRTYKGRIVFRGDTVRNETGFYAMFSEQGTSASHLAASKFLDAIARRSGNDGEDSGGVGAYTQIVISDVDETVETWTSLLLHKKPMSWN